MPYPTNYRYTREHEWIQLEGNIGSIGITDYAQNSLGDIVYVDVPKVGDAVTANATFGSVESVKAVSDLYAPIGGEVIEINTDVANNVQLLAEDPYDKGWLIKIKVDQPPSTSELLDLGSYERRVDEESH